MAWFAKMIWRAVLLVVLFIGGAMLADWETLYDNLITSYEKICGYVASSSLVQNLYDGLSEIRIPDTQTFFENCFPNMFD